MRTLNLMFTLLCLSIGQTEAAVENLGEEMTNYDVNDIIKLRCCPADDCYPSQAEVASLNNKLKGRVIVPHFEEYVNQSHMYNTFEQRYPRLVVMVHSKEDIRDTVLFARKYNLHVTMRSSGHDFVGRSTWDGSININLSEMKDYEINLLSSRSEHGEVKVQTGLTWAEIYEKLDKEYNRTIVGGSAHTVTPGGYTIGGGHSPISRSLGYAVDNVLEVQVVLADGRIATCIESRCEIEDLDGKVDSDDGDLFWALRGGGGGTFGVVVYFVFKLHAMPTAMVRADTWLPLKVDTYGLDYSERILSALGNLITTMPREWGGYYLIGNEKNYFEGIEMTGRLQLAMNKFAPWDGSENKIFEEFIGIAKELQTNVTFTNLSSFWDYEKDASDPPITRSYIVNTLLQPEKVNGELVKLFQEELFTNMAGIYFGCTGASVGGRTTDFSIESTPLHPGYRTAVTSLTCGVALADPQSQSWFDQSKYDELLIPKADAFSKRLQRFGNGMYLNEPTKNNPNWREDFWGDHYTRLLQIKKRYDPENFFTCHHCVGSEIGGKSTTPWSSSASISRVDIFMATILFALKYFM
ncbi:uncharacterized protein LOC132752478 [Ruditapes philippinarum]|uniref:uncharacterized protein LOC132752478 n=1 Tax=Ruditapes philippinarum TaxID=129788 RepID=UPI00295BDC4A|nr:uncharacterized protein LOC132752478 [Ruditapes philippinarum]